jgi:ribosomal protein L16 Arg81 hydroxylase
VDFAEFIAPLSVDEFMADYYGRRPVHIPACERSRRGTVLNWPRLNHLLSLQPFWTEENLRLMKDGRPLSSDLYMEEVPAMVGTIRRASPAKIDVYLAMGVSLVAHAVQQISAEIAEVTEMLAERLAGRSNANIYCSFQGVRALATHCDAHEIFALHCEGEKVWRIYENRADAPLRENQSVDNEQGFGPGPGSVMFEARMRSGDLLYIPRGFYHDALAGSSASLHLTLSVEPRTGAKLVDLLGKWALREPAFRAYMPDSREREGATLRAHLEELARRAAEIIRSPAFFTEVANSQRKLMRSSHVVDLPRRPMLESFVRTKAKAAIRRQDSGATLWIGDSPDGEFPVGPLGDEAEWLIARSLFSLQELFARYPHQSRKELRDLVALLVRCEIVRSV